MRHFPGFPLFNGEAENFRIVPEGMNFSEKAIETIAIETITKRMWLGGGTATSDPARG
jgi:hypothetical protein